MNVPKRGTTLMQTFNKTIVKHEEQK